MPPTLRAVVPRSRFAVLGTFCGMLAHCKRLRLLRARLSLRRASPPPPSGWASARSAPRSLSLPLRPLAGARRPRAPRSRPRRGCASASRSAPWRTPHLPGLRASLLRAVGGSFRARWSRSLRSRSFSRSARAGPPALALLLWLVSSLRHAFARLRRDSIQSVASLCVGSAATGIHASR